MKKYIEAVLHQDVDIHPFTDTKKLPLVYRNRYMLSNIVISGQMTLLAEPVEHETLSVLKKQHRQLELYTGTCEILLLPHMR